VNLGVGPDALPALERPNFGALAYTVGPGTARSPRKRSPILMLALRKTASSRLWLFAVLVTAMVPANAQKIVLGIEGDWWDSGGHQLGFASQLQGECVFGQGGSLQIVESKTKHADPGL